MIRLCLIFFTKGQSNTVLYRIGTIKPYKGNKYKSVEDRYADGWALNASTHRWIKVAIQQKKAAIEAQPALLVS